MSTTSRTLPLRPAFSSLHAASLSSFVEIPLWLSLDWWANHRCKAPLVTSASKSVGAPAFSGVASPGSPAGQKCSRENRRASLRASGKRVRERGEPNPGPQDLQRDSDDDDGSSVDDESESSRTDRWVSELGKPGFFWSCCGGLVVPLSPGVPFLIKRGTTDGRCFSPWPLPDFVTYSVLSILGVAPNIRWATGWRRQTT